MSSDMKEVKFNQLCRVCLTKTESMRELFNSSGDVTDLVGKLSSIIRSEIDISNKTHPNYICSNCEEKLNLSYEFQELSIKSQQTILDYTDISESSHFDFVKKEEFEDVPLTCEGSDNNENDNNSSHDFINEKKNEDDDDETEEDDADEDYDCDEDEEEEKPKRRTRSTKKVDVHSAEEVKKYIIEVKRKFYTSRNCLFCGFTSSNVRTLSVHMSRLHGYYKEKWCWKCNQIQENLKEHTVTHNDDLKCPFCTKQSTTSSHFVEHLLRHSVKKKHVCQTCGKDFISGKHLQAHCRKIHKKKTFACEYCSNIFSDKKSLAEHVKEHETIKCKICQDNVSQEEYGTHLCFNTEKDIEVIFDDSDDIKKDDIENTNEENIDKKNKGEMEKKGGTKAHRFCKICKRRVRNLLHHIDKHHNRDSKNSEPKALCTYCGKQFKHHSNLEVHIRTHTKETPYKCSYCDVSVATRTRLVDHERTHTGEKPFVCRICGKAFKQHGVLNTHLKLHTGKPEQCLLCPKRFCRPSELRNHMRVHTGEKPFACSYCDKRFIQRSHLVEHTKIHTDHRPFKCHICGKAFKQSSTLKGHLLVHDGKKMFSCTFCTYSCRKSYTLKQHLLQHQNENRSRHFSCDGCEESFPSLEMLNSHQSVHMDTLALGANISVF